MATQKQIIALFKQKDYRHFDQFYDETKHKVFYAVINIVKDPSLADDIIQDTYMRFLANIDKVNANKNVHAYLQMIARNLAIDLYNERKKVIQSEEVIDAIPSEVPEETMDGDIFKILDVLEDREKEIVTLHVINDLKFREIADIIETPLGTVLWLYQKAIKKLKKEVGEEI